LSRKKHNRAQPAREPGGLRPKARAAAARSEPPRNRGRAQSNLESPRAGLLIVLAVTAVAYARCFGNKFVYDDIDLLVHNPQITHWSFLWESFAHDLWWFRAFGPATQSPYYRPLQDAWLGFNYHLWGFNPVGWHVMIVAAHLTVVWLVYELGWRLLKSRFGAAAGAILFGVMPVHVQAAAWPVAIPVPAVTGFMIAATLMFMGRARAPKKYIALSLLYYALGLLTYELAIVLPVLLAAYVVLLEDPPGQHASAGATGGLAGRALDALWKVAPFLALTGLYLLLRIAVLGFIARHGVGNTASLSQGLLSVPAALAQYLILIALPWSAGLGHDFQLVSSVSDPRFYLPLAGLLALATATAAALIRSPRRALYGFLIVWLILGLAPVLNLSALVPFALIQDRYAYLSSVGFCLLLGDVAARYAARGGESRSLTYAICATVLAINLLLLWNQLGVWHDEVTLFSDCVRRNPQVEVCHSRLAMALEQRGDLAGTRRELERALALDPNDGGALFNLANVNDRAGRYAQAADGYRKAIAALPYSPPAFYLREAQAAAQAGEYDRAAALLKHVEADPKLGSQARYIDAQILANRGDYPGALRILRGLAEATPDHFEYWAAIGAVLEAQGEHDQAARAYAQAIRLNPRNAELTLMDAQALHSAGRDAEALAAAREALRLAPASRAAQAMVSQLTRANAKPNNSLQE
jgi:tetratricopeptide (TPR) repeat protein